MKNVKKVVTVIGLAVTVGLVIFIFKSLAGSHEKAAVQSATTTPAPTAPIAEPKPQIIVVQAPAPPASLSDDQFAIQKGTEEERKGRQAAFAKDANGNFRMVFGEKAVADFQRRQAEERKTQAILVLPTAFDSVDLRRAQKIETARAWMEEMEDKAIKEDLNAKRQFVYCGADYTAKMARNKANMARQMADEAKQEYERLTK